MFLLYLSSAWKGHHNFLLANIRGALLHAMPLPPLPSVIHKPDGNDQPWATAWSLLCSLLPIPSPSSWSCPNSSLWFSPAVSGGFHWHGPLHVQSPSFVRALAHLAGWPGLALFSLCGPSQPGSLISGAETNDTVRQMTHWVEKQLCNEKYIDLKPHVKYIDICS